jgi:hypothetical protein
MALVNRDKDASEQRDWITWSSNGLNFGSTFAVGTGQGAVPVGATLYLAGPMPYNYVVQSANAMTFGTSGAPQLSFGILRPVVGQLATLVAISISNMVICSGQSFLGFGASAVGFIGYSGLAATGSTLLNGQRGDILVATTAVANTCCNQLVINMVVQKVQDIVTMDGV